MLPLRVLSRRAALLRLGGGGLAAAFAGRRALPAAAQSATPVATPGATSAAAPLPAEITAIIEGPRYAFARWGIHVADRQTGEPIYDLNGDERFLAASTTKLYPAAAALAAYGPDYRFETPVYRTGAVGADGTLAGNLILVASADPTMGGRTTPSGQIAFTPFDHIYANVFPTLATLTPENPLAGLDDLARQVAAAGVRHVAGDVVIDARLFPAMEKDGYVLSPVWINDNLIDISLTPGAVGDPATLTWRPQTAAYRVQADVRTVAPDEALNLTVSAPSPGTIAVAGQIPVTVPHALQTYQVMDPPAFARTLLIEALGRAGVTVAATATGPNPEAKLPAAGSYAAADRVALFTSPKFAQNIKLILKVSMNQHADLLIFLLALKHGEQSFDAGLAQIPPFLRSVGLDPDVVSLSDGRGNEYTDLFSPRTVSQLLRVMATRPDFPAYFAALPILGVDGSEIETVAPTSPVRGKAFAKSGTTVAGDAMNQRPLTMVRALSGYLTAQSGRELIFALYVSDVPLKDTLDVLTIIKEQGSIAEIIYARN
ncbi:MAG TPA: D-alanyl-D-alanine carboxypeptidase/D-alanyl-D-alanine-endopeptidase [Thermomicrobiales bacterium]|nr:D-alanyl-D-alanine carboxypeptidase/D-alanyl-D-alanine-endopeptidase [Thermomicrobiales bacterium]